MSKRYTGGVVSSAVPTVNAASASGIFTLGQQATAQSNNNWPPFKVEKSLRFRASALAYLSRTPSVAGNQKTWTWSGWVKRSDVSTNDTRLFGAGSSNSNRTLIAIENYISVVGTNSGSNVLVLQTSAFYRDPSAWYHIVIACDTTQSTSSNRVKIYVNGVQVTAFGTATYPAQNTDLRINSTDAHVHGTRGTYSVDSNFDGYMAEVNLIDGQQLTPSSFGGTDKDGNWSPIAYTGTYGQNGFYLNFKDATSTTTLGYDYSGNGNNWTPNNLSVTAGVTYDSMIDVPEDQSDGTANNRGNYCTLNPLALPPSGYSAGTFGSGNLQFTTGGVKIAKSTMAIPLTGKWYIECRSSGTSASIDWIFGLTGMAAATPVNHSNPGVNLYISDTVYWLLNAASQFTQAGAISSSDVFQIAYDSSTGKVWLGKNNTYYTAAGAGTGNPSSGTNEFATLSTTTEFCAYTGGNTGTTTSSINFGQQPFTYTPPTGFKTLNTYNLPEPTIKQPNKHFDISTYTGNDSGQSVTNAGVFQPSLIWYKARSAAYYNTLIDDIRGAGTRLFSNLTDGESNDGIMTSFNTNGFTLGANSGEGINKNAVTYVAWQWKGATSNTTNTSGTITSNVRANPTAGFSIVTYTGNGTDGATVGHGLGATPAMIIVKRRNAGASGWSVYFTTLSAGYILSLQSTNGQASSPARFTTTLPTSSVFSIGTDSDLNANGGTYVAYCFAQIAGYSAFGSYTGNGSTDGPFIYTGFRPKFIMWKNSSAAEAWLIEDTARSTYNQVALELYPSSSGAEAAGSSRSPTQQFDYLSNGFKVRGAQEQTNGSGNTIIYAAFAEMPFKYSRSR